jgi:hypothetical protein
MERGLKYPLAQVVAYGPNSQVASKLVASIFPRPGPPSALRRWTSEGQDIRQNPAIMAEVNDFIASHHPAQTVHHNFIFGCPHEEGVDYPEGEECPRCPFWMNLDRLTLEPKSLVRPLTVEQILAGLSHQRPEPPLRLLAAVDLHREKLVGPFVQAVEHTLEHPNDAENAEAQLFCYALGFLGKWRAPQAFPLVHRWLSLPEEDALVLTGDLPLFWGARLLARTGGQEIAAIKQLIINSKASESGRCEGIEALALLVAQSEYAQAEAEDYFGWLMREGLSPDDSEAWEVLIEACIKIEAVTLFNDLRQRGEDLMDPFLLSEMKQVASEPRGARLARYREEAGPFEDLAVESRWAFFHEDWEADDDAFALDAGDDTFPPPFDEPYVPPQPYIAPPKVGRNDPCPCGSGKKYKKCCGA